MCTFTISYLRLRWKVSNRLDFVPTIVYLSECWFSTKLNIQRTFTIQQRTYHRKLKSIQPNWTKLIFDAFFAFLSIFQNYNILHARWNFELYVELYVFLQNLITIGHFCTITTIIHTNNIMFAYCQIVLRQYNLFMIQFVYC